MTLYTHQQAKRLLADQRQMTSLIDKDIIARGDAFVFDRTDWVPLYDNTGYAAVSERGNATAYRAVTLDKRLLRLVFTDGKSRGFHARAADPVHAVRDAFAPWARRREVRRNWYLVERTAKHLLTGRARFAVRIEDAHASPLSMMEIEGFLRSLGLGRIKTISGRAAALLMQIETQVGLVIYEAMRREGDMPDAAADHTPEGAAGT